MNYTAAPTAPYDEEEREYDPLQDMQDFLNSNMPYGDKQADEREGDEDEQPWD